MSINTGYYVEVEDLFVEWEYHEGFGPTTKIEIINVQLPDQSDPTDESKWLDITNHLSDRQLEQLVEQINETLQDDLS